MLSKLYNVFCCIVWNLHVMWFIFRTWSCIPDLCSFHGGRTKESISDWSPKCSEMSTIIPDIRDPTLKHSHPSCPDTPQIPHPRPTPNPPHPIHSLHLNRYDDKDGTDTASCMWGAGIVMCRQHSKCQVFLNVNICFFLISGLIKYDKLSIHCYMFQRLIYLFTPQQAHMIWYIPIFVSLIAQLLNL